MIINEVPTRNFEGTKYRLDIDGLRAIAVLSVVGFHAFPDFFRGGFVGVDVFFVISGFLISSIIFNNLAKGSFSFLDFYSRRVRRIFPALALVLLSALCLGWFVMFADEYKRLGLHVLSGAGFFANFVLWQESGYFASAAEGKPLLHLWSLGIEEQFYIVWPMILWMVWRFCLNPLVLIVILALISFTLNIWGVYRDPVATFYLPHTRFWELLVGAGLASITLSWSQQARQDIPKVSNMAWTQFKVRISRMPSIADYKSITGILILVAAIAITNKAWAFPGWWASLPVLGSALLISAGPHALVNRVVLSSRVLVFIGLISYPLYLWHWLLLSFAQVINGGGVGIANRVAVVLVSFILSWGTYELVESPLRFGRSLKIKAKLLILVMSILAGLGYFVSSHTVAALNQYQLGAEGYLNTMIRSKRESECFDLPNAYRRPDKWYCTFGPEGKITSLFAYGDSHAFSMLPAFEKYADQFGERVAFLANSGCPPLLGVQSWYSEDWIEKHNCRKTNERIFEYVKNNKIKTVVLVGRWTYYVGGLTRPEDFNFISSEPEKIRSREVSRKAFLAALQLTVERYGSIGTRVYWVADNPQQKISVRDALRKSANHTEDEINKYAVTRKEHLADQDFVRRALDRYSEIELGVINFDNVLCDHKSCPIVRDGKSLYFDLNHLSVFGAELLVPYLARALHEPSPEQ